MCGWKRGWKECRVEKREDGGMTQQEWVARGNNKTRGLSCLLLKESESERERERERESQIILNNNWQNKPEITFWNVICVLSVSIVSISRRRSGLSNMLEALHNWLCWDIYNRMNQLMKRSITDLIIRNVTPAVCYSSTLSGFLFSSVLFCQFFEHICCCLIGAFGGSSLYGREMTHSRRERDCKCVCVRAWMCGCSYHRCPLLLSASSLCFQLTPAVCVIEMEWL